LVAKSASLSVIEARTSAAVRSTMAPSVRGPG
jgi:hypothetical protein